MNSFSLVYCKKCLTPNTRPLGVFSEEGICSACLYAQGTVKTDFESRFLELKEIIGRKTRHRRNKRWDSIVGVSGGKDSTRQAIWARDKLGLRPLLVSVTYPHRQMTHLGAQNLQNLVNLGFDCETVGPAPIFSKQLVRESFFRYGNFFKATEMALFAGVPQVAIEKGIDLILWGENGALQVGDSGVLGEDIWDANSLRNSNTLQGGDLSWFEEVNNSRSKLSFYRFPSLALLEANKVDTIFMGPAWSDWSNTMNSQVALLNGFSLSNHLPTESGDLYGTEMLDDKWLVVNNLLKYFKFGFSRGTEQSNSLIRAGLIQRNQGIDIAINQDSACSESAIQTFCDYIEIPVATFWTTVKRFTNPFLFEVSGSIPSPKFTPGSDQTVYR